MLDDYFLSIPQKKTLDIFFKTDDILFITGGPGIGKTSLSREIFKDKIITEINTLNIKSNYNLEEYLLNIVRKQNITLMFSTEKKLNRGIIIDNLDSFYKSDKKTYKMIINFLKSKKFYGTKIICISTTKFSSHKTLLKLDKRVLKLEYAKHSYYKILDTICDTKCCERLSFDMKTKLLVKYNYNLNAIISNLEYQEINQKSNLDLFNVSEVQYKNLFTTNYSMEEVLRYYDSERITISLNLLENIIDYIDDINTISLLYRYYEYGDNYEKKMINDNTCSMYTFYTIYKFYSEIRDKNIKITTYRNNKYLSHSFIYIHANKIISKFSGNNLLIYLYLYLIKNHKSNDKIISHLRGLDKDLLDHYIKLFNYFTKSEIKKNDIL